MIKLKRGAAPGLKAGRPDIDPETGKTRERYRYVPGPALRQRGFKSLYLLGAPGEAYTNENWTALGWRGKPAGLPGDLTFDGPPLGLEEAIQAACALNAAARGQEIAQDAPKAARPAPQAWTVEQAFATFLEAAKAGQVTKRGKGARPVPISPQTIAGYEKALRPVAAMVGDFPARTLR